MIDNKATDVIQFKGIFNLELYDVDGKLETNIEDDNIIVNTSYDILTGLMVDGNGEFRLNTLKVGDGGVWESNIRPALATEDDLYNVLETKIIANVTLPDVLKDPLNRLIKFTWVFEANEANGDGTRIYNEAGLFSNNGVMFSKKNFSEVIKTSNKKMIVTWTIKW